MSFDHDDPGYRQRGIAESIARKQAEQKPKVDAQGRRIEEVDAEGQPIVSTRRTYDSHGRLIDPA